jgi:Ser/Thr protein kinase RdoA (MazF antagonist)
VPDLGAAAEPLLDRLTALHAAVPADPAVSAHHDFRPAQVLLDGDSVGFIDFDGACMAEPALDLGRFCAKLRDIGMSAIPVEERGQVGGPAIEGHLGLLDELCEEFVTAYRASSPVTAERVTLWETIDLVTGVLHAWTKVRVARLTPRLTLLRHAVDRSR